MHYGHGIVLSAATLLVLTVAAQVNPAGLPVPTSYAPNVNQPCPATPLVRAIQKDAVASDREQEWVAKRDNVTAPVWNDYLKRTGVWGNNGGNAPPAGFKPPRLAIAVSGGGLRAMTYGASILAALDSRADPQPPNGGVLQLATYLSGLSGGSWLLSLLYLNNFFVLSNATLQATWDPQVDLVTPGANDPSDSTIHRFLDSLSTYKSILDALQAKRDAGFQVGLTDFWGGLIAAHLPPNLASAGDSKNDGYTPAWSAVAGSSMIANATAPLPFIVSSQRSPGENHVTVLANVWSSSPFETGSDNEAILAFVQTAYLGTNVSNGNIVGGCTTNLDQTSFITGASSSLFNIPIALLSNSTSKFTAISDLAKEILQDGQDTAEISNPFYQLASVNASISSAETIELVDGGEGGQNIPLRPMLSRAQVILAIDSSADTETIYPNGTSLVVSAQYAQWMNDTPGLFPPIPKTPDAFVAQGLDRRVTVFGCGSAGPSQTPAAQKSYTGPVIIYVPSHGAGTNISTYTLGHTPDQTNAFFDTANSMLSNDGDASTNGTCLACSLLVPSFRADASLVSPACRACLDSWCWNGSTQGEPGWEGVPVTKNYDGHSLPPPVIGSNVPTGLFGAGAAGKRSKRSTMAAVVASGVVVSLLLF